MTAKTATAFFTEFVVHYGLPNRQSGNGIWERFNRSLLGMLGTLDPEQKVDWKSHIGSLVHAYNCTRHDSTGYAPYYLMFVRKPRLALDVTLGFISQTEPTMMSTYLNPKSHTG